MSSEMSQHTRAIKEQTDAFRRLAKAIEHHNQLLIEIHRARMGPSVTDVGFRDKPETLIEHYMGVPRDIKED